MLLQSWAGFQTYWWQGLLLNHQACDWKKILKLTGKLKKACFSGIAQIKLAYIVSGTVFRLYGVKDPYRQVWSTILCCFWDFCNILHHITGVSI